MKSFTDLVNRVIKDSDIILMVVDARRAHESINKDLEHTVHHKNKHLLYVINKCDLISHEDQLKIRMNDAVQISAEKHWGTMRLLKAMMKLTKGRPATVGVIGYPNTGKSSVINALKGRHSAPTSPISGCTRGLQKIRVNKILTMIDTPGIIPYYEKGSITNIVIGAVDAGKLKDVEGTAMELIVELKGKIEKAYGVEKNEDPTVILENIAIKKSILKRGGEPDTARVAKDIIMAWQKGKIR